MATVVGPEVIAGSTRLKAGTAQKLVLNTISTATMIRLGRTYGGLMIGVAPANDKLRERARRNVALASGASEDRVDRAIAAADGDARVALVSLLAGVDADSARARLEAGARIRARGGVEMRLGVEAALVRGELVPGDVEVEDGRVVAVGLGHGRSGRIAIPGLVDIQINGYGGIDFLSAATEDYQRAGEALLLAGVTAYQPTFITSAEATTVEALQALPSRRPGSTRARRAPRRPVPLPERPGTHPPEHLRAPDVALLDRLLDAGPVTEMTLAPELPGADALIRRLRERGVVVSAGHTNATAEGGQSAVSVSVSRA